MVSVLLLGLLSVAAVTVLAGPAHYPDASNTTALASLPEDCDDIFKSGSKHSGEYTVYPRGYGRSVQVYCEMDCEDEEFRGGWTVFQKRLDGTVNFYRPWEQYKKGFGNISGEHWLGLENLFAINWQKQYMLRVDMEDFEGGSVHACYSSFSIESESDLYRLRVGSYIDGGAGNSLIYSNDNQFSTFDHGPRRNEAERYHGGFWFRYSYYYYYSYSNVNANPNGLYRWGRHSDRHTGVLWNTWKSYYYSLKSISMKIRPLSLEYIRKKNSSPLQR